MYKSLSSSFIILLTFLFLGCTSKELYDVALNYERSSANLSKKSIKLDMGTIVYLENNIQSKKTLILLHGFGGTKDNWNRLVTKLGDKYHVVAPDLPGHGESLSPHNLDYSIKGQSSILKSFVNEKGLENIILVGNSMGGAVALYYASKYPINSLILIDSLGVMATKSVLDKEIEKTGTNPFLEICTAKKYDYLLHMGMEKPPYIPGLLIDTIVKEKCERKGIESIIYKHIAITDLREEAKKIRVPTLILWGGKDKVLHVDNATLFHKIISNSEVKIFDELGHVPMLEEPDIIAYSLQKFLSK